MDFNSFLAQLRAYNQYVLAGGLGFILVGIFAMLIMNTTNWWNLLILAVGVVVLVFFLAANLAEVKEVGKKHSTLVRANLALVAVAMLGLTGAVNYIISRHPVRIDLTSNKLYTLSEQTQDILHKIGQDVNVTFFSSSKRSSNEILKAQQLLEEYGKLTSKFHFKVIDIDKSPTEAKRLGIHEYNTVVFESGDNRKDVLQRDYVTYALQGRQPIPKFQGEGAFTAALIKMNNTTRLTFYFTEGHGEREMNSPEPDGLNTFKDMLDKENYNVKSLNLMTAKGIMPTDAAVLAIVGPTKPFQPSEVLLLEDYLKNGGKVVVCLDPIMKTGILAKSGLEPLLKQYGVKLGNDIVYDTTSFAFPDVRQVIPQYGPSPIVEKLSSGHIATIMPFSRSVQKVDPELKNVNQSVFMQSSDSGWGETNFKQKPPKYDAGVDTKAPVPMAMTCEVSPTDNTSKKTRLVVYGNSNFFTNQFLQGPGNLDVGLNSFSWAAEEEDKVTIHPKEDTLRVMNLSNVAAQFIKYLTVIIMPIGVLVAGGIIWYRRRSL